MHDLARQITSHTRLVAVGYASNAVGTINNVKEVVRLARDAGALSYIDAVHYAPHGLIDVRALDCDFLACSTYKFFGPHMGVLYGKREHLQRLRPYKVRPNTNNIPQCWEWGTLNHECIAGIKACVDYWEELGHRVEAGLRPAGTGQSPVTTLTRREAIVAAHAAIHPHERAMTEKMIAGLLAIPGLKLYGITDPRRFDHRCATFVVRIEGHTPLELATKLGERGFFTWDGNYYALNLTEQLDVERLGGFLRIGLVHYNTMEEVERMLGALREIVRCVARRDLLDPLQLTRFIQIFQSYEPNQVRNKRGRSLERTFPCVLALFDSNIIRDWSFVLVSSSDNRRGQRKNIGIRCPAYSRKVGSEALSAARCMPA